MTKPGVAEVRCCCECGKPLARATRVEDGNAYCRTCYSRVFKRVQCFTCGQPTRARQGCREPVCSTCQRKDRCCSRCGKSVVKASRIIAGKAICAACSPYFTEPKACTNCQQPSRRLSRAPEQGFDEPVCNRCRNRDQETCSVCRRYRKVARRDTMQRPLCRECGSDTPVQHDCPVCGSTTPGGGASQCAACALKDRVGRRVRLNVELLEQPWVRSLFEGFCAWEELPKAAPIMTKRIDRHALFFADIDRRCSEPQDVTQRRS